MRGWLRRNHWWRPLAVVLVVLALLLTFRSLYIPSDFGIHGSFTYNLYRANNLTEWQSVTVKYQGREFCGSCHDKNYKSIMAGPHSVIQCENCHGPGIGHPDTVKKLTPGNSQQLCWRCHVYLPYDGSGRSVLPGIEPGGPHAPLGEECYTCHNPHAPQLLPGAQTEEGGS